MTSPWVPAVEAKLAALDRYAGELENCLPGNEEAYLTGRVVQRAVERVCQLILECVNDANALILDGLGQPPPQSAREGMDAIERAGVLPPDLSHAFRATFIGFRNRLVHDYETIENRIVYRTAHRLLEASRRYGAAVSAFLARRA